MRRLSMLALVVLVTLTSLTGAAWAEAVSAANEVRVEGAVELTIKRGDALAGAAQSALVEHGQGVTVRFESGVAVVVAPEGQRARATIQLESLSRVETKGAVHLELVDLRSPRLRIRADGTLTLRATGRVQSLELIARGVAHVDAPELKLEQASVRVTGSIRGKVHVTSVLDARIEGIAELVYRGAPDVNQVVVGLGELRSMAP